MEDKNIVIDGFTVQYGKTTEQELVNRGYSISDFEPIIEEPVLASYFYFLVLPLAFHIALVLVTPYAIILAA